MTSEEFHMMDIAIHPKIFVTKKGREIFEMNGIPQFKILQNKLKSFL
jgi:hypothetical protein